MACEEIVKMHEKDPFKYVKIFSDSQAAIAAIDSSDVTSQAVLDTKVALNKLAKLTRNTVIVWIKAHMGHDGNEVADEMAKQGTTSKNNIKVGIPLCETMRLVEEFIRGESDLSLIHI